MKARTIPKVIRQIILIAQIAVLTACASAKEEAFDYSSYEQKAGLSDEYFAQLARNCSDSENVVSDSGSMRFRACSTRKSTTVHGIQLFSAIGSVHRMCVFPTKVINGVTSPIEVNSDAQDESRFLKICGTIAYTGSTALLGQPDFSGLLIVDGVSDFLVDGKPEKVNGKSVKSVTKFSQCLAQSDFRSCARNLSIDFAEGSL